MIFINDLLAFYKGDKIRDFCKAFGVSVDVIPGFLLIFERFLALIGFPD